jgi:hypothetical protein
MYLVLNAEPLGAGIDQHNGVVALLEELLDFFHNKAQFLFSLRVGNVLLK